MRSVESLGGPLVLLLEKHLRLWKGIAGSSSSGGKLTTDYDRACAVEDYLGIIQCSHFDVLVLGDEPLRTAWFPHGDAGMFIRWVYPATESSVLKAFTWASANAAAALTELTLSLAGRHRLQDAAAPGDSADGYLAIDVSPGLYQVRSGAIESELT